VCKLRRGDQLLRGRAAMRAARHTISASGNPADTFAWLARYGYRGGVSYPGTPHTVNPLPIVLLFARTSEPIQMASIGETLRWDARRKVVLVEGEPKQ
jgi:hypothetical protein